MPIIAEKEVGLMKIRTKLIYGFFLISLFVAAIGMLSLYQINKIALPLNKDVPESIDEFTQAEYLDGLAQFIRYYDEVLTQSARNYAFTQNQKWEQRYRDSEPQLDSIIKDAISKGDEVDKEFFSKVDEANLALVKMEYESIDYVNQRKPDEAIRILESDEYWNQKRIYEQGLRDYVAKRGNKYEEALVSSTKAINTATENVNNILRATTKTIWILVVISFAAVFGLGYLIANSISKPIAKLEEATKQIAQGNLDARIELKRKDELGALAESFNSMASELKNLKKSEKRYKMKKELEALESTHKSGFISEETYKKGRTRIEESLIKTRGVTAELLQEKGLIKKEE